MIRATMVGVWRDAMGRPRSTSRSLSARPFRVARLVSFYPSEMAQTENLTQKRKVGHPLPEARAYRGVARFGADVDEFVEALDLAVKDTSEESVRMRLESVKGETWVSRVE